MTKRIFLTSSINRVAFDIAKKIGGAKNKKILYIYTAGDKRLEAKWQKDDRRALVRDGFEVIDYTIVGKTKETIKKDLKKFEIVYVGGGNTFYLLEQIQQTKCAGLIRDFVNRGKIYISTSAGSVIAGPDIYPVYQLDRVEEAPKLKGYKGIGLVDFVVLPHWGKEDHKERYLNQRLAQNYNVKNKQILLNDYQYIEVRDDFYKIVEVKHRK